MTSKLNYINTGIACRIGDKIYLNNRLKAYPELHRAILMHENEHSSGFVWRDLILDINNKHLKDVKKDYYLFILKNPSSWTEFLPVWKYNGKWVFNPIIAFVYFFSVVWSRFLWTKLT